MIKHCCRKNGDRLQTDYVTSFACSASESYIIDPISGRVPPSKEEKTEFYFNTVFSNMHCSHLLLGNVA